MSSSAATKLMCKTKMDVTASEPSGTRRIQSVRTRSTRSPTATTATSSSSSGPSTSNAGLSADFNTTSSSLFSSRTSLTSLRNSLSQNPHIYDISEIRAATNNFLAKRYSSAPCWRCNLRNADTIVFQRKFRRKLEMRQLKDVLGVICRFNHGSVIKLLGASISGDYIYLVYEFVTGANLADCLRNSKNPNFTVLSKWLSRIQIAADLSSALDYIHHQTGLSVTLVHNHIKSSSIVVGEPNLNAKICHFRTAQLCGEAAAEDYGGGGGTKKSSSISKEDEVDSSSSPKGRKYMTRSSSGGIQFEGVRGYMSPEFQITGMATQRSDVYAFGVVILELLSGEEPLKYNFDKARGDFVRTSLIETARAALGGGGDGDGEREGKVRRWIDRRLKDSFPVEVAERLTRVALDCVEDDPDKRPDMGRVAAKISKMYLSSKKWSDTIAISNEISVSLAPR